MPPRLRPIVFAAVLSVVAPIATVGAQAPASKPAAAAPKASAAVDRGRYLARIAGCNDCHTPGYAESAGKVPEDKWLTGDNLGWRGPWGTTYAANLRLTVPKMTETQWVKFAKTSQLRPPMPWFALRDMTESDLRAIYRLIVFLGPGGSPAPAYVPPNLEPKQPYVTFPAPPK